MNVLTSTSKAHILPRKFLNNEFDVDRGKLANSVSSQSSDKISKAISKKRKFGELWGLGRKIMKRTSKRVINEVGNFDELTHSFTNNNCITNIRNPIERRLKGHPKSKRIANSFEKSNTKMSYKCKLCKKKGHNSKTCKEIDKSDINVDKTNDEI
ncbi:7295_t:CDS:2 [Racocetra fulgida]|uniref:7295_t:CDS:1 n=1 Tax=Racocetra fulgida TaxID=60492 RepID=A0A9N9F3X0_9GLOM|nr:7295_t:CDS:2 [Racocetra fulgida]